MQLRSNQVEAFLTAPPAGIEAVLIYGLDAGLIRERSKALEAAVLGRNPDPFRLVELDEAALEDEPGALYAEAAAISMLGGKKFVRVRTTADVAAGALESYLALRESGAAKPDALVVFEAGDIKNTGKLRKLAEASALAAAISCHPDSDESLETLIDRRMKEAGARLDEDAKQLLLERLGSDRGVSRQEIEKLLAYAGAAAGGPVGIRQEDVRAVVGDSALSDVDHLLDAVLAGDSGEAARLAKRLRNVENPVRILRSLSFRLDRLGYGGGGYGRGQSGGGYHARWSPKLIARARTLILEAEIGCKTTGLPAEAVLERTLLQLARGARESPPA